MDKLIETLREEWEVVTSAPISFGVTVFVASGVAYAFLRLLYRERLAAMEQRIQACRQENELLQRILESERLRSTVPEER